MIECVGCRGLVPDVDGPVHRYMTASPGCWQADTELMASDLLPVAEAALSADAYAVTHPAYRARNRRPPSGSTW